MTELQAPETNESERRMDAPYINQLEELVRSRLRSAEPSAKQSLYELMAFVDSLHSHVVELQDLKQTVGELRKRVGELESPPLQYGVCLGVTRSQESRADDEWKEEQKAFWQQLDDFLESVRRAETAPLDIDMLVQLQARVQLLRSQQESDRDIVLGVLGQRHETSIALQGILPDRIREGQEVVVNKMLNVVGVRDQYVRGETGEVVNVLSPTGTARVLSTDETTKQLRVQSPDGEKFTLDCEAQLADSLKRGDIVEVSEDSSFAIRRIKPRLHVRSGGNDGIVVEVSEQVFEQGVEIGDIVRVDTRLQFAFEKLPSYETGGLVLEQIPDVTYEDIGGLSSQIEEIRDAIELPYVHRNLFDEYKLGRPTGILLHGPPGCGKTMIAKAVASSLTQTIRGHLRQVESLMRAYLLLQQGSSSEPGGSRANAPTKAELAEVLPDSLRDVPKNQLPSRLKAELLANDVEPGSASATLVQVQQVLGQEDGVRSFFLNVKGPELLNKYVGETEHRIRKVFEEAKRRATYFTPVVIFFDEMEAMFRTRGSGRSSDVETTIVPQFLAEMDGVEVSENVVIIGASNRPELIDPAILRPGRLDVKIKIDRPDQEAAASILGLYLTPELPLQDTTQGDLDSLSAQMTFSEQVIRRSLSVIGNELDDELLDQVSAAIHKGQDVRRALDHSAELKKLCRKKAVRAVVDRMVQGEWIAESMIAKTVGFLFDAGSQLEVLTAVGKRHTWPLSDFISGAALASVVSRAKKIAVKRKVAGDSGSEGIYAADLEAAAKDEFSENAETLVTNRLVAETLGGEPAAIQFVEVKLGKENINPWVLEKARPYAVPIETSGAD